MSEQRIPPLPRREAQLLKGRAHALKPVVMIGAKGLTPAVMAEIELALETHELIKIKLAGYEKEERQELVATICQETNAHHLQLLGAILTLYREKTKED